MFSKLLGHSSAERTATLQYLRTAWNLKNETSEDNQTGADSQVEQTSVAAGVTVRIED